MQVQVNIEFDQLVKIVRSLPADKLKQLKVEIEEKADSTSGSFADLETLLLNGPVATKKQLAVITANTKSINQWRIK